MNSCAHTDNKKNRFSYKNSAFYALIFTISFAAIEALFGIWSGSLALLGDAGHMCADSLSLLLAAFAIWIKRRPATAKHTYGFARIEVIAAWISSILLFLITISIAIKAFDRFHNPHDIASGTVIIVALIGLFINILVAWILHKGEKTLNTRAALLHVFSDLLASIAVLISGVIIHFTGWNLIDPILSIFICILIFASSIKLLKESFHILMEGTPSNVDSNKVKDAIKSIKGVQNVHDLHIWTLTTGTTILTAHVVIIDYSLWPELINDVRIIVENNFGIKHSTIQIETPDQITSCTDCNKKS